MAKVEDGKGIPGCVRSRPLVLIQNLWKRCIVVLKEKYAGLNTDQSSDGYNEIEYNACAPHRAYLRSDLYTNPAYTSCSAVIASIADFTKLY